MMEKGRILFVVQSPGGVERYLQSLFKYLNRDKYEVFLVASTDYCKEKFINYVDKFEYVDMVREINMHYDICAIRNVRKIILRYNPDIVYCHSSKAGAIGRIANIGLRSKCIYNSHGWAFNMCSSKIKKEVYVFIERLLAHFTKKIICISEAEYISAVEKKICSKNKLIIIENGIDFEEYDDCKSCLSREKLGIPIDAFVIGMVGRITEQKAPDIFVKAAKLIKEIIPNAFFMIVGDGEDREKILEIVDAYGLRESFKVTGWIDKPLSFVVNFDVALLLSRWEGFGLVLAEYMIAQKPIVATRVDAIPKIIQNNENGLLVDCDDPLAVSNAVKVLYDDKDLCCKLTKSGMEIVKTRFDARRVAFESEMIFNQIMNRI